MRTNGSGSANERDIPSGAVVCLFVGRLSREKGVMDLMRGVAIASAGERRAPGGRAGHGRPCLECGPAAREFVERHGLGTSVRFLGPIADVAPLLRAVGRRRAAVALRSAGAVGHRGAGVRRAGRGVGGRRSPRFRRRRRERQAVPAAGSGRPGDCHPRARCGRRVQAARGRTRARLGRRTSTTSSGCSRGSHNCFRTSSPRSARPA